MLILFQFCILIVQSVPASIPIPSNASMATGFVQAVDLKAMMKSMSSLKTVMNVAYSNFFQLQSAIKTAKASTTNPVTITMDATTQANITTAVKSVGSVLWYLSAATSSTNDIVSDIMNLQFCPNDQGLTCTFAVSAKAVVNYLNMTTNFMTSATSNMNHVMDVLSNIAAQIQTANASTALINAQQTFINNAQFAQGNLSSNSLWMKDMFVQAQNYYANFAPPVNACHTTCQYLLNQGGG